MTNNPKNNKPESFPSSEVNQGVMTEEDIKYHSIHHHKQEESVNVRLANWVKLLIFGILLEALFREKLYNLGITFIKTMQIGIEGNTFMVSVLQGLSFMATKNFVIFYAIMFFNFFDMYTTLILIVVAASGSIGTGFFKLIYKNPRPFFHEEWVKVYDCETGYGNPSGHSILAVSIYLTLWKILRKKIHFTELHKRKLFFVLFSFIACILVSRLALGAHSLNQILLGSFIGYEIYLLFFYVIKIDLKLHEEIKILMNIKNLKIAAVVVATILILGILIFNFYPLEINLDVNKYLERIHQSCPGTPYSKTFDYEAYFMLAACSSIVGAYYGIYYDIKFNLKNSHEEWSDMNFGEKLWNRTNLWVSVKRLALIVAILLVPFSLTLIVSSHAHTNYIFILKNLVPYFLLNFMLFALGRHVSMRIGYGNQKLKRE